MLSPRALFLPSLILALSAVTAAWPHIEACRNAWPAEPCAYLAGRALVVGTCESTCENNDCANVLTCRPRRWNRQCDGCGSGSTYGGRGNSNEYGGAL